MQRASQRCSRKKRGTGDADTAAGQGILTTTPRAPSPQGRTVGTRGMSWTVSWIDAVQALHKIAPTNTP